MIYYYCSVEAFQNIVKNKKLWLSDVAKSNDRNEIMLFVDMIKNLSLSIFSKLEQNVEGYTFIKSNWYRFLCKEIEKEVYSRICLGMCFSNLEDDLSQWRAYGDDGRGFCIGFSGDILSEIQREHKLSLVRVLYRSQLSPDSKIEKRIKRLEGEIRNAISRNRNPYTNIENSIKGCVCELVDMAPRIKDVAFSAEAETRLFYWDEISNLDNVEVRFSKYGFVPYIELDVSKYNNLIKKIYIGPTNNGDVDILQKYCKNYNLNVDVKKSNIGYRS